MTAPTTRRGNVLIPGIATRRRILGTLTDGCEPRRGPAGGAGRKPTYWTAVDRDDETLRINMHTLVDDLAVTTEAA